MIHQNAERGPNLDSLSVDVIKIEFYKAVGKHKSNEMVRKKRPS